MLNFTFIFLILTTLNFQQDVPLGNWKYSSKSAKGDSYYFDSKYMSKVGDKVTVYTRIEYKTPGNDYGKNVAFELQLIECECKKKYYRFIQILYVSKTGEIIYRLDNLKDYKDNIVEMKPDNSVGYAQYSDICRNFYVMK